MIKQPTTLILGAGASAPFRFPTGKELKRKIIELIDSGNGADFHVFKFYCKEVNIPDFDVHDFKVRLSKSGKESVDAFLEHNPELIKIGKAAIAAILIRCEQEQNLFDYNIKNNWYEYLFNRLNTSFEEFDKNSLKILTFNYDRSLEHYLFTVLENSYRESLENRIHKMKHLSIVHLHGDLGALPHLEKTPFVRPYTSDLSVETLKIAVERIKVIHQGFDNSEEFKTARKIISESRYVCFLGFGYHHLNVERLGFVQKASYPNVAFLGSTMGFTAAERFQIQILLHGRIDFWEQSFPGRAQMEKTNDVDVLTFLRETAILSM